MNGSDKKFDRSKKSNDAKKDKDRIDAYTAKNEYAKKNPRTPEGRDYSKKREDPTSTRAAKKQAFENYLTKMNKELKKGKK